MFVVFAVIRIITAIFLKTTMDISANDAEMMANEQAKKKQVILKQLEHLFDEADTSGDGLLGQEELNLLLQNEKVKAWLSALGLEVQDTQSLFALLDDGEGEISAEEFVASVSRLKGQARAIDVIAIQREIESVRRELLQFHDEWEQAVETTKVAMNSQNRKRPSVASS